MFRCTIIFLALASVAVAHEFDEVEISSFQRSSSGYLEINLQNTGKGREVVCGIYDADGKLLTSDNQLTDNLATRVLIRYEGDDAASARCAFND